MTDEKENIVYRATEVAGILKFSIGHAYSLMKREEIPMVHFG